MLFCKSQISNGGGEAGHLVSWMVTLLMSGTEKLGGIGRLDIVGAQGFDFNKTSIRSKLQQP